MAQLNYHLGTAVAFFPRSSMAFPEPPPIEQAALWRALTDLLRLLQARCNEEARYQTFFERHPVTFRALGFDRYASFEKASGNVLPFDTEKGYTPEPDFLCAQIGAGQLTIFELKTPFVGDITTSRSDGNRLKFKASAESYLSQAREYVQSIRGNVAARQEVMRVLDLPAVADYDIVLVYGLGQEWDEVTVRELLAGRSDQIQVVGFDQMLDALAQPLAHAQPIESLPGWTYVYHLSAPPSDGRRYFADCGALLSNRVSFLREGDLIAIECLDAQGKQHRVEARCDGGTHYVRFEFSRGPEALFMSLHVDDEQHDLRVSKLPMECDPDPGSFVMGTSLEGGRGAAFRLYETYSVGRTMTFEERLGSHVYFLDKLGFPLYMDRT